MFGDVDDTDTEVIGSHNRTAASTRRAIAPVVPPVASFAVEDVGTIGAPKPCSLVAVAHARPTESSQKSTIPDATDTSGVAVAQWQRLREETPSWLAQTVILCCPC